MTKDKADQGKAAAPRKPSQRRPAPSGKGASNAGAKRGAAAPAKRQTAPAQRQTSPASSGAKRITATPAKRATPAPPKRATPPPAKPAYGRRRLVALVLLLAVLGGIAFGVNWLINGRGEPNAAPETTSSAGTQGTPSGTNTADGTQAATATPSPAASPSPTLSPLPTEPPSEAQLANPVACLAAALAPSIELPAESFGAGSPVRIATTVANTGQVPCLLDAGAANLVLTIFSGEDRVWSSADCPEIAAERPILLAIDSQDSRTMTFAGTRSAPECPADQAVAGAGMYRAVLSVTTGGETAQVEKVFTLT